MNTTVRTLVLTLLREAPARGVPLDELHRRLSRELPREVGTAAALALDLERDPAFRVSDCADPLCAFSGEWDEKLRCQYRSALLMAGQATLRVQLSVSPQTVSDEDRESDALDVLDISLDSLEASARESGLVGRLAEARAEYGALRHAIAAARRQDDFANAPHHHSSSLDSPSSESPASRVAARIPSAS